MKSIANDLTEKYSDLNINNIKLNKHNIHQKSSLKHLLLNQNDKVTYLNEDLKISKNETNPLILGVILYDYYLHNPENNHNSGQKAIFYFFSWNNIFKNKNNNEQYFN